MPDLRTRLPSSARKGIPDAAEGNRLGGFFRANASKLKNLSEMVCGKTDSVGEDRGISADRGRVRRENRVGGGCYTFEGFLGRWE